MAFCPSMSLYVLFVKHRTWSFLNISCFDLSDSDYAWPYKLGVVMSL